MVRNLSSVPLWKNVIGTYHTKNKHELNKSKFFQSDALNDNDKWERIVSSF